LRTVGNIRHRGQAVFVQLTKQPMARWHDGTICRGHDVQLSDPAKVPCLLLGNLAILNLTASQFALNNGRFAVPEEGSSHEKSASQRRTLICSKTTE
jgi:hypothetical protein